MLSTALVTVVIATNRESPFFAAALASVVEQTHASWEIVVVDNGVPDRDALARVTADVPRTRILHVPPPVTVSLARNVGVAAAQGEYVVFLDDDDIWHAERLAKQIAALAEVPEAPASYCGGWHMDATGTPFPPAWPASPSTASDMLSGRGRMPHICGAMLIRRAAFAAVGGFSPELSMMEDFELALRLAQRGDLVCVPDELVGYRRHDRNATNTGLANVRVRRDAIDGILSRHAWAARVRGDAATAGLLAMHRSRERRRAAAETARASLRAVRHGRWGEAATEARWGLARSPRSFLGGLASVFATR